ncbi:MAG: M48 family metallopeptidase, partial [Chromatiales bacterium]|nr:M48 family metallopeptidase [Chromatiales bacterium]
MKPYSGAITYGGEELVYEVLFVRRKTLEMAVHPDLRVIIKAPQGVDIPEIEKRIKQRACWIKRQLDYFRQFSPRMPPRRYIGGESHLYLGRQYRLKLIEDGGNSIKLSKG